MIELMVNIRFSEPPGHIQLDVKYVKIVPTSELLCECKVQGSYYHSTSYLVSVRVARICSSEGPFGAPWCL